MSKREKIKGELRYLISILIVFLIAGGIYVKRLNDKVVINYHSDKISDNIIIKEEVLVQID